ncbi:MULTISPECIES: copper resistance protein NlpE [Acinetobacter]|uniref:copper resistance protein NlpE n=1 Tax=Acinetobacter TaxID=469 RepID=UPI000CDC3CC6|nr:MULTISPECIES: copper resistance protein NlpE [Acinetobacter]AUX90050.1 copper homeostasis protein CutF [Acinetobacter sp. ACNIH1]MBO3661020.1 copper resistance protein NlpE N-terminal domain-containing protein [Acinetobacter variabilis]MCU4365747.1 copper resistance protein NlpE N-terminal domain-containing protein [Acinetobacter variabilis]MCU4375550.1 copper resistance protein NlpE N-terminal domain-containing protein [Acinetobacter variabilis]UXI50626.1 copper resistance protein NlpE N-t
MKKILWPALLVVTVTSLSACSKQNDRDMASADTQSNTTNAPVTTETTNSQSNMSTEMTSKATVNSNWAGEYEGVFPCADCEGIKVELDLNPDKTYELSEEYLGKTGNNETETKGSFTFDSQQPSIIVLDGKAENRKFYVGDNFVEARDIETGKEIQSNLNYKLVKKSP